MFKFFREKLSFGADCTATKIIYLCCAKNNMRDLNILDFDKIRDVLAKVLVSNINYQAYTKMPQSMRNTMREAIANALVKAANSFVGNHHPHYYYGNSSFHLKSGNGMGYATEEYDWISTDGGDTTSVREFAISFAPSLFLNSDELNKQLKSTFEEINCRIALGLLSNDRTSYFSLSKDLNNTLDKYLITEACSSPKTLKLS